MASQGDVAIPGIYAGAFGSSFWSSSPSFSSFKSCSIITPSTGCGCNCCCCNCLCSSKTLWNFSVIGSFFSRFSFCVCLVLSLVEISFFCWSGFDGFFCISWLESLSIFVTSILNAFCFLCFLLSFLLSFFLSFLLLSLSLCLLFLFPLSLIFPLLFFFDILAILWLWWELELLLFNESLISLPLIIILSLLFMD